MWGDEVGWLGDVVGIFTQKNEIASNKRWGLSVISALGKTSVCL